jgi:hypothetical protein
VPIFELLERPYCSILRVERWNAPAGRWFVAYRARHGYRWLLGTGVVDEFATVSSPFFIAPRALLGRVYETGISLAHKRDAEMALDLGWPPFCAGIDKPAGDLPPDPEADLLALMTEPSATSAARPELDLKIGRYALERWRFNDEVAVIGTDAPLLPQQLGRLCDVDASPLTVALAKGNRVMRPRDSRAQELEAVSEGVLNELIAVLQGPAVPMAE